jgi:hypothetical protein
MKWNQGERATQLLVHDYSLNEPSLSYPQITLVTLTKPPILLLSSMWPALSPFSDQPMEPRLTGTIFHPIGLFPAVSYGLSL